MNEDNRKVPKRIAAAVLNSLKKRDQKDSSRATSPLQIALGARIINSTGMSIEQVVDVIVSDLRAAGEVG